MKALLPQSCGRKNVVEPHLLKVYTVGVVPLRLYGATSTAFYRPCQSGLTSPPSHTSLLRVCGDNELASLLVDLANDACPPLHRVAAIRRPEDARVHRCVTTAAWSPRVIVCMQLLWKLQHPPPPTHPLGWCGGGGMYTDWCDGEACSHGVSLNWMWASLFCVALCALNQSSDGQPVEYRLQMLLQLCEASPCLS